MAGLLHTERSTDELLTEDQIRVRYPDRWVLMTDLEMEPGPRFICGRVIWQPRQKITPTWAPSP